MRGEHGNRLDVESIRNATLFVDFPLQSEDTGEESDQHRAANLRREAFMKYLEECGYMKDPDTEIGRVERCSSAGCHVLNCYMRAIYAREQARVIASAPAWARCAHSHTLTRMCV